MYYKEVIINLICQNLTEIQIPNTLIIVILVTLSVGIGVVFAVDSLAQRARFLFKIEKYQCLKSTIQFKSVYSRLF